MNKITINGRTINYAGNNIVINNGKIIVDGNVIQEYNNGEYIGSSVNVIIKGDVNKIDCNGSVEVHGNAGAIDCGGSCQVGGNVVGDIDAGGSVTCGKVSGDIDAGGRIMCQR